MTRVKDKLSIIYVRHGKLEHTFSNYGSGTLLGIPTYWSSYCTVDPITTMKELVDLNKMGTREREGCSSY